MERIYKEISLENFINEKEEGNDNIHKFVIKYNNKSYKAMVVFSYNNNIEYHIWNESGNSSIYSWGNKLPISIDELKKKLDEYSLGYRRCQCCGKLLSPKDKAESYFAGVYCMDCWTPEMAAQRESDYSD